MFSVKILNAQYDEEFGNSLDHRYIWFSKLTCCRGHLKLFSLNPNTKRCERVKKKQGSLGKDTCTYHLNISAECGTGNLKNGEERVNMTLILGISNDTELRCMLDAWTDFFDHILSIIIIGAPVKADTEKIAYNRFGCVGIIIRFVHEESCSSFLEAFKISLPNVIYSSVERTNT